MYYHVYMQQAVYKGKRRELASVVDALNGRLAGVQQAIEVDRVLAGWRKTFATTDEARRATELLRQLVEAWRRDADEWDQREPELFRNFKQAVEQTRVVLRDRAFLKKYRPLKAYQGPLVGLLIRAPTPEGYAAALFLKFLNLTRELGVNAITRCDRCNRYFVNRFGHRGKRFCQRRCAVGETVQRGRTVAYGKKLARVIRLLRTQKPEGNWKAWVDQRTGGKGDENRISKNWLTHAVKSGVLTERGGLTTQGRRLVHMA
jgi:hypothetical protein